MCVHVCVYCSIHVTMMTLLCFVVSKLYSVRGCFHSKFLRPVRNRCLETWWWHQIFYWKWKYGHFAHAQWKICNITLTYGQMPKFRSLKEIGVGEHEGDVRLLTGSANTAVSCMRIASGRNYRNSLVIVDLAMEQIPRSVRISSYYLVLCTDAYNDKKEEIDDDDDECCDGHLCLFVNVAVVSLSVMLEVLLGFWTLRFRRTFCLGIRWKRNGNLFRQAYYSARWHFTHLFLYTCLLMHPICPMPSHEHHQSFGNFLENNREDYRKCSVLYHVLLLCTVTRAVFMGELGHVG